MLKLILYDSLMLVMSIEQLAYIIYSEKQLKDIKILLTIINS